MQQVLSSLLDLQEIDEQLGELDRSKVYLPEIIENINSEMRKLEKELDENQNKYTEAQIQLKQIELDIEADKESLGKYQNQMKVIKTNKEYDALVAEIDSIKQKISDNEDETLRLMGVVDESSENIEELKVKLEEAKKNNQTHLENLRSELNSLESKIKAQKSLWWMF